MGNCSRYEGRGGRVDIVTAGRREPSPRCGGLPDGHRRQANLCRGALGIAVPLGVACLSYYHISQVEVRAMRVWVSCCVDTET